MKDKKMIGVALPVLNWAGRDSRSLLLLALFCAMFLGRGARAAGPAVLVHVLLQDGLPGRSGGADLLHAARDLRVHDRPESEGTAAEGKGVADLRRRMKDEGRRMTDESTRRQIEGCNNTESEMFG